MLTRFIDNKNSQRKEKTASMTTVSILVATVIQLSTRSHEEVTGETPFSVESVMVDGQCGREMCGMMSVVLDEMLTHTVVVF
jgi:hypothetical protein